MNDEPDLRATFLFDALRGTRVESKTGFSSVNLIQQLKSAYSSRVEGHFFRTPLLGRIGRLMPPRINEIFGVQHIKSYVFDDTVIISGANLSNDYFTARQDRYVVIESKELADFFSGVGEAVGRKSLVVDHNGILRWNSSIHPTAPQTSIRCSVYSNFPDFLPSLHRDLSALLSNFSSQSQNSLSDSSATFVFPTLQAGFSDLFTDSSITQDLLESAAGPFIAGSRGEAKFEMRSDPILSLLSSSNELHLSSAYFNITPEYKSSLLQPRPPGHSIHLMTASPKANGFYGSSGFSGHIPAAYSMMERKFREEALKRSLPVEILEYERPSWTFHAKGLWHSHNSSPFLTLIGSSNFGTRSTERDLEAQVLLVTADEALRAQMKAELNTLREHMKPVNSSIFASRSEPLWMPLATPFLRRFM